MGGSESIAGSVWETADGRRALMGQPDSAISGPRRCAPSLRVGEDARQVDALNLSHARRWLHVAMPIVLRWLPVAMPIVLYRGLSMGMHLRVEGPRRKAIHARGAHVQGRSSILEPTARHRRNPLETSSAVLKVQKIL